MSRNSDPGRGTTSASARFAILVAIVLLVTAGVYAVWRAASQQASSEGKALAEARTLTTEIMAAWDYVDSIQSQINRDATGRYDFKNVYCAVAGKAIAQRFMRSSDYTIRYVRENPRSVTDEPDDYELAALDAMEASGVEEYYGTAQQNGQPVFRYVSVLRYKGSCLTCHGEPAGEKDETGFLKEGQAIGDIAGAASITIPMSVYQAEIRAGVIGDLAFFVALTLGIVLLIRVAFTRWLSRPLAILADEAHRVGQGDWGAVREIPGAPQEVARLSTSFEQMARQLGDSYALLEEKVAERTCELATANQRLQDEVAYKSDFLSLMSHELKTPITSIMAARSMWQRAKRVGASEAAADEAFSGEVQLQCTVLMGIVDNALAVSRLEQGRWEAHVEKIDLVDVLDEAERAVSSLAQGKGVRLSYQVDPATPLVDSDADSLARIVDNLASNAVKFTPVGGSVRMVAAPDPTLTHAEVRVIDTGIGIAPADQERIFERFVQLDSSLARAYHGSGLGLALARELAERIGASLRLESAPGTGSTFTLDIPVRWEGAPGEGPRGGEGTPGGVGAPHGESTPATKDEEGGMR